MPAIRTRPRKMIHFPWASDRFNMLINGPVDVKPKHKAPDALYIKRDMTGIEDEWERVQRMRREGHWLVKGGQCTENRMARGEDGLRRGTPTRHYNVKRYRDAKKKALNKLFKLFGGKEEEEGERTQV